MPSEAHLCCRQQQNRKQFKNRPGRKNKGDPVDNVLCPSRSTLAFGAGVAAAEAPKRWRHPELREAGKNAGVAVPIPGTASPMTSSATLTDAQAADLMAGKWYVNVHTADNKGGEIRGQLCQGQIIRHQYLPHVPPSTTPRRDMRSSIISPLQTSGHF